MTSFPALEPLQQVVHIRIRMLTDASNASDASDAPRHPEK